MNKTSGHLPNANISTKSIFDRFVLAFFIWAVLSAVGFLYGNQFIKVFEGYYLAVIETVHPEYSANITYDNDPSDPKITLFVTALKDIHFAPGKTLPAGTNVGPTKITVFHTMVPIIIFGVIVLAWPVKSMTEFVLLLLYSPAFTWMKFTEGGARWLIPILVGILCAALANKTHKLLKNL